MRVNELLNKNFDSVGATVKLMNILRSFTKEVKRKHKCYKKNMECMLPIRARVVKLNR